MRLPPIAFVMRRLHSFVGLWLILFLCEHLLVNAQAGYGDGLYFIAWVNRLQGIPHLHLVEALFIALPFLVHGAWGIHAAYKSKNNAAPGPLNAPVLSTYPLNRAFRWQRITAWFLLVAIAAHVFHMRIASAPEEKEGAYQIRITEDAKLAPLVAHLGGTLEESYARLPSLGAAFFIVLRETCKQPLMVIAYILLVCAACYHAFHGLWTALLTWGVVISVKAQLWARRVTTLLMAFTTALGLFALLGTVWSIYS